MGGKRFRFSMFGGVLTIFCMLEVLAAKDIRPRQNSSPPLTHVPAENLDGHIELSTLDLLSTTAPSHPPPSRKPSKHVIKRPIHQNSTSKINSSESVPVNASTYPSSREGREKESSIDGQASTDISKAHYAGDQRDKNHDEYEVGGGIFERKGSGATGNEHGDEDLLHLQLQGKDHHRKVLKQIKKRPSSLKHSNNLNSNSAESTTRSLETEIDSKVHQRQVKSPSENSKNGSQKTTPLSSFSLIWEAVNGSSATSEFSHDIVTTATEESEDFEIDMSTSAYPEQNDQVIALFTQTGPEHDESLFEFSGSTEQDIFEIIDDSRKEDDENSSEKYTVSLPKSFSKEYTDIADDSESTDITKQISYPIESTSTPIFNETSEEITLRNSNMVRTTVSSIYLPSTLDGVTSTTSENVVETTIATRLTENSSRKYGIDVTQEVPNNMTSATDRVENVTDIIDKVPMKPTPQDTQYDSSTETTQNISTSDSSLSKTVREDVKTEQTASNFPGSTKEFESSITPHSGFNTTETIENVLRETTALGDGSETTTSDSSKTFELRNNVSSIDPENFITAFPNTSQDYRDTSVTSGIVSAITEKQSSTDPMLDSSIAENNSVTEQTTTVEIVTIDPAHWYGINTGGDVIEVHPDTEESENVSDIASVATEQQASTSTEKDSESSTNTMLDTFATEEKSLTTEGIVTVDPAQWYNIDTGNGDIEVHPDTEKSENITEIFGDEQRSTEAQAKEVTNPDISSRSNTSGISNNRPEHPEDSKMKSNNRSDKALPLDKIDFEYDIKVETTSATSTADHTTESRKEEIITQVSPTSNLLDQGSLKLNGNSEHSDLGHISDEIHEDKRVVGSNKEYGDVVEVTTIVGRAETDIINSSTQFTATPGSNTSESTTEVPSTSLFTTMQIQYTSTHISTEGTTVKDNTSSTTIHNEEYSTIANVPVDTSTINVIDSEITSHSTEVSITTGQKKTTIISTAVKENLPSVLIPNGALNFTEHSTIVIDKEVPTRDYPKASLIPSLMKLQPISYKNVLEIVESDETEQDDDSIADNTENTTSPQKSKVLSEKNGDEKTKTIDMEVVSNQSKTEERTEGHNNTPAPTKLFLCDKLFGNDSVFIAKNIVGEPKNVSIHIKTEDVSEYVPSDVHILEDLNHQLLNFTWKSPFERLNNSLALFLNYTKSLYVLSGIHLNIVRGGVMLHLQADVSNESQISQKPEQCNFTVNLSSTTKVTFSNLDFLKIREDENAQGNIQMGTKATSGKHQKTIVNMEIVVIVMVIVVIIFISLYLLIEKHKKKTMTSDKSV